MDAGWGIRWVPHLADTFNFPIRGPAMALALLSSSTSLVGNAILTTSRLPVSVRMEAAAETVAETVAEVRPRGETVADLKVLAGKLNPKIGYWNPLGLGESNMDPTSGLKIEWWGESEEAVIGWLRHTPHIRRHRDP